MPDFHRSMKDSLRTPEQGADTVVWLAVSEAAAKNPSGRFYQGTSKTNIFNVMFIRLFIYWGDNTGKTKKCVGTGGREDCWLNYVFVSGGCVSVTVWPLSIAAGVGCFWCQIPPESTVLLWAQSQTNALTHTTMHNDPSGLEEGGWSVIGKAGFRGHTHI